MYISDLFTYNTVFVGNQSFECIIVSFGFLSCKFCVCLLYIDHLALRVFGLFVFYVI